MQVCADPVKEDFGHGAQQPLHWGTVGFSPVASAPLCIQEQPKTREKVHWVIQKSGCLENPCSVSPLAHSVWLLPSILSVWVPTKVWDSVPQFSACKGNKLNLPYSWKVWGNKYTDNHELLWILTWPLGELQVTNNISDRKFLPSSCSPETEFVPWSQKISACFKSWEGFFLPSWHHFWWFIEYQI